MIRKSVLLILAGLFLLLLVVKYDDFRKREYTCLTPDEIEKCNKYQEEVDKSYPQYSVFPTDYSWT